MSNTPDFDNVLLPEFLDESVDSLSTTDNQLIQLEAEPENADLVNAIFRPIHSLKGNSAYFGLMKVKELSHEMENLLDAIRKERIEASIPVIEALLPGVDMLRQMLERVRGGRPECDGRDDFDRVIEIVRTVLEGGERPSELAEAEVAKLRENLQTVRDRLSNDHQGLIDESLELIGRLWPEDGKQPDEKPGIDHAPEHIRGLVALLEKSFDGSVTDDLQGEIDALIEEAIARANEGPDRETAGEMRDVYDTFTSTAVGLDDMAREMLLELALKFSGPPPDTRPAAAEEGQAAGKDESPAADRSFVARSAPAETDKTMRIPERSLDTFLDHVGELLGVEEMFRYLIKRLVHDGYSDRFPGELKQVVEQFGQLSGSLRKGVMDIRKIEARALLLKAPRIVRDIAASSGKRITVCCLGQDTRIDKSYIDLLDAPLTHMVRNAADHGIEPPGEREARGKPGEGTISIGLSEHENEFRLTVEDDGGGLDYQALARQAASMGFAGADGRLSEDEVVNLLFKSGVTTAKEVTDVSGRGVGMDVVKRAIEAAGGRIQVASTPGQGCAFTILLPKSVSTKIIDGYLVSSGAGDTYVLPMKSVVEAFVVRTSDLSTVVERGRLVQRRGMVLPLVDLDNVLGIAGRSIGHQENTLVSLDVMGKAFALSVKDVVGVQRIVVKPVDGICQTDSIFEGAAMMGDGSVALIIGEEGLSRIAWAEKDGVV